MEIQIKGLSKHYYSEGKTIKALDNVDIIIPANKIFTLLGPSGCGKTTLLRCIVGLESPDEGEITIGGEIVWSKEKNIYMPTENRGLGMVFQTYAIWPHMNVYDNVSYPLQVRGLPKNEIAERVKETLKFVQLEGYEKRPATRLSGGQQQRVALARALVAKPKVILFDEPLSNLDAKLREETRKELRDFLDTLKITAVYVTHDRVEALALSDIIAVMKSGKLIEQGSPKKIYFDADSQFVADFIGRSNLIEVTVTEQLEDKTVVESVVGKFVCQKRNFKVGDKVTLCLRPEFIDIIEEEPKYFTNIVKGKIATLVFIGDTYEGEISVGNENLLVKIASDSDMKVGDEINLSIRPNHCLLVSE